MKKLKQFVVNLKRLRLFLKKLDLEPAHLFFPSVLSLGAALLEGGAFALLVPTMRGIIEANYQFAYSASGLGWVFQIFPQLFLNNNTAIFIFLVALILVFIIMKNVFAYSAAVLISHRMWRFNHQLRCLIFNAYVGFRKSFFDKNSVGNLQNILTGYTEQIAVQFKLFQNVLFHFFALISYLIIMVFISWRVALFTITLLPIIIFSFKKLIGQIKLNSNQFAIHFSELGKKILNSLSCMPLIKASSSEEKERKWFERTSDEVRKQQINMDVRILLIPPMQEVFFVVLLFVLTGFVAYLSIHSQDGSIAGYLVFFVIARRAMNSIGQLTVFQANLASIAGPLRQIMKIFEERKINEEISGGEIFVRFDDRVIIRNLTFFYHERDVLRDVSFEVKKNEMIAIVGKTGSGKSTLAQLFMRFYEPPRGTIFIDGKDIFDLQIASWRKKIAFITQDNYLFDASFEVNVKYGCEPEPLKAEILDALEKAQLSGLLSKLPQGLATEIGERGIQLSGGERQRLSLARAILRKPEILILDEATSALDSQTEQLVQRAILETVKGKTSIVIAHRLSTIKNADKIILLEEGRIVEQGSFDELIALNGRFKSYWMLQEQG
ncbi:MAG TPA: ABC transporter ATP-binding protein [Candidatus Omnitrophota bacterium]|mgnify:CR=1 FL=1|nr:ABC transporter ATP-binding protein [Candidatus Omnitrophota bacterium]